MSKSEKLMVKLMSVTSDASFSFRDMVTLLLSLGFNQRRGGGSHQIFQKGADFVNLQNAQGKVKEYQVRQIRKIIKGDKP